MSQQSWRPEPGLVCDFCDQSPCTCGGEEVVEEKEEETGADAPEGEK